jgi:hypothetical protein
MRKLLDEAPGFAFSEAGPVYVDNDLGTLAWRFGPEGQPPVVTGFDISLIRDGVIAKLYTVLTLPEPDRTRRDEAIRAAWHPICGGGRYVPGAVSRSANAAETRAAWVRAWG